MTPIALLFIGIRFHDPILGSLLNSLSQTREVSLFDSFLQWEGEFASEIVEEHVVVNMATCRNELGERLGGNVGKVVVLARDG